MSRRKGRILAFQAVYSWDVTQASVEDLLTFSWTKSETETAAEENETVDPQDSKVFASLIIAGTIEHIKEIDKLIEDHLSASWSLDRINKVTLAILRTSIYELAFVAESQSGIVIDEAVNIAKDYGTDDSYKFINAVLDKIGKNGKAS
ncbi:MAG: transcription antitermination factor NusB [Treponema sp.]|nr:transcription antitermination factor NusB [Treponema sp.]